MRNKIWVVLSVLLGVALVLAACQPATPTPQVIVETVVVEARPRSLLPRPRSRHRPNSVRFCAWPGGRGIFPRLTPLWQWTSFPSNLLMR